MLIGYARVSTDEQNLSLQRDALSKAGCERVFTDTASGAPTQRPGLVDALSHLRKGDSLVVWKLDRLGRSVKGLVDLVEEFETRQIHFRSLTDGIDTKTPAGRFFFHVMASLAQMERELDCRANASGTWRCKETRTDWGSPAKDDDRKNRVRQTITCGWDASSRRGPESGRFSTNAISVVTGGEPFLTRLILGFWNRHGALHSGPITRLSLADSTTSFVTWARSLIRMMRSI